MNVFSSKSLQKTLWKNQSGSKYSFFCPQCRSERAIAMHPRPDRWRTVLRVIITAAFMTMVTWPWFGAKGVVWFLPLWVGFELYYRTRVRTLLACPLCGFDPYLYLNDVQVARQEMEKFWRAKFAEKGVPYPESGTAATRAGVPTASATPVSTPSTRNVN